jgi:hypothetical protein
MCEQEVVNSHRTAMVIARLCIVGCRTNQPVPLGSLRYASRTRY